MGMAGQGFVNQWQFLKINEKLKKIKRIILKNDGKQRYFNGKN